MGRHRTARAKQKLIRNTFKSLGHKRNRDIRLKQQRAKFVAGQAARVRHNQQTIYADAPDISVKASDLTRIKKEVNAKFLARVEMVQNSFNSLHQAILQSPGIIEVVDARDPLSFRFIDVEREAQNLEKPLIILLTKIDLVPMDNVSKWITALNATAPTIAVSLLNPAAAIPLIKSAIADGQFVAVGAPGVGKTTLCSLLGGQLVDSDGWRFTMCGNSLALANSVPWKGRIREFAVETLERVANDAIFPLMGIAKEKSIGNSLVAYARKLGITKQEAPAALLENFIQGNWRWFADAPMTDNDTRLLSAEQINVLSTCCAPPADDFVVLGQGEPVKVDDHALDYQPPGKQNKETDGSSDSESEEEDDQ